MGQAKNAFKPPIALRPAVRQGHSICPTFLVLASREMVRMNLLGRRCSLAARKAAKRLRKFMAAA